MTQPRFLQDGVLAMVTRRAVRRTHLFRPDRTMTNAYVYLLAWAASRHGVRVIAATLMSTHEHLIVEAPDGAALADFMRDLHRLVALTTKVYRKWEGAVWDHEEPSVVLLRTPEALVEKLAYVMANPVAAGCVHKARLWPGLRTGPEQLGAGCLTATRPTHFLDAEGGRWPETLELAFYAPDTFGLDIDRLRRDVAAELARLETEARKEVKAKGWAWIGVKKLIRLSPFRRARSFEALTDRNPTFAVGKGQREAFFKAVSELRAFRNAYRAALAGWRLGDRSVLFPAGTLAMHVIHGVRIAPD